MRTKSVFDDRYFMLFIDDFSRMIWIVYLKENLETFHMFKVYKEKVKKEIDKALKCLGSN